MAIGIGKMIGFNFLENLQYPYVSTSVQEFWRRWHISLSSWFRDYVYIPLGGNRHGTLKTYRNLIIVFLLTGLWHGASWNFVLWGVWHGLFLIIERAFLGKFLKKLPRFFGWIYTMTVVFIGWVFFRIESFNQILVYVKNMFWLNMNNWGFHILLLDNEVIFFFLISIALALGFFSKIQGYLLKEGTNHLKANALYNFGLSTLFMISILWMVSSRFNPFIYFRF
jgi:alginate O-acetyltransferase complex protein AlgI